MFLLCCVGSVMAQELKTAESEADYYQMVTLPIPKDVPLEVGGLTTMPDGRLAASTRQGDIWLIENPYMRNQGVPYFKRFAQGLHEPLGLAYHNRSFYLTQRSELTRIRDTNGDDRADDYEVIYSWPLSGNYHEYSYGPVILPNNDMLITLNLAWIGRGASLSKWHGWMLKVTPDGKMTPVATGMRSPAGFNVLPDGSIFYAENQGDWVGSGRMTHVEVGDFVGNPEGLKWADDPSSPVKLRFSDIPSTGKPMYEVAKTIKGLKLPAIWFPQGILGISTSGILIDTTAGAFGPFTGQMLVGDQGQSKIMRIYLEKVKGQYQGAAFPFREGFQSGILRMVWGEDGSMFVGMTSRGWAATGKDLYGIQRLVWTGKTPFEIKTMQARPDGFELEFTQPVDKVTAGDANSYGITSFNYMYRKEYGSPVIENQPCTIKGIAVADDGLSVRIVVDGLREGYIHELKAEGVRSQNKAPLLHSVGYYTLNNLPEGEKLVLKESQLAKSPHAGHAAMMGSAATTSKTTATKTTAAPTAKRVTKQPASWTNGPDQTITIGTKPGLKFDLSQITVKAGSKIKLTFNNNDDMLHNFVVTLPGEALSVGEMAIKLGLNGAKMNYIPSTPKVLYHTAQLQPQTSETIYFVAPEKPGEYMYVCTFPGHYMNMQGTFKVIPK
ncbi:cupredoxin domain-containing protein [Xanthocytophaga agilis]